MGFKFTYFYHSGSLCFGSFIIAFLKLVRFLFIYAAQKVEKSNLNNCVANIIKKCAECVLDCLEKVTDYITS